MKQIDSHADPTQRHSLGVSQIKIASHHSIAEAVFAEFFLRRRDCRTEEQISVEVGCRVVWHVVWSMIGTKAKVIVIQSLRREGRKGKEDELLWRQNQEE